MVGVSCGEPSVGLFGAGCLLFWTLLMRPECSACKKFAGQTNLIHNSYWARSNYMTDFIPKL